MENQLQVMDTADNTNSELLKVAVVAYNQYEEIELPAWVGYKKIQEAELAAYHEKVHGIIATANCLNGEYELRRAEAWNEYVKSKQKAKAKYNRIQRRAWAEFEKIGQPALTVFKKERDKTLHASLSAKHIVVCGLVPPYGNWINFKRKNLRLVF